MHQRYPCCIYSALALQSCKAFHGAEIAMFSVISNVSKFLSLVLFVRKAGRYTSSSLLLRWREKQLLAGL